MWGKISRHKGVRLIEENTPVLKQQEEDFLYIYSAISTIFYSFLKGSSSFVNKNTKCDFNNLL